MLELPPLAREQVRSIDAAAINEFRMRGICLMENAGRGAAERISEIANPGKATILCGSGNNGGDGYVIARHLQLHGWQVRVQLIAERDSIKGDAKTNLEIAVASKIEIADAGGWGLAAFKEDLEGSDVIVDALLGTGATGNPRGAIARAIEAANAVDAVRVAVDLPSGLDCDSGEPGTPCFHAQHTLTFVAIKLGFAAAKDLIGEVHVVSIGAPLELLQRFAS